MIHAPLTTVFFLCQNNSCRHSAVINWQGKREKVHKCWEIPSMTIGHRYRKTRRSTERKILLFPSLTKASGNLGFLRIFPWCSWRFHFPLSKKFCLFPVLLFLLAVGRQKFIFTTTANDDAATRFSEKICIFAVMTAECRPKRWKRTALFINRRKVILRCQDNEKTLAYWILPVRQGSSFGCGGRIWTIRPSGYEPDELPSCSTPRYMMVPETGIEPVRD